MDTPKWRHTAPVLRPSPAEYAELLNLFAPRIRPYNFFTFVDSQLYYMEPLEYLICYSNELTAIGFAKDLDNLGDLPLTMQLGTYEEHVGREIYIGCTVIVKSYARMLIKNEDKILAIINWHSPGMDIFLNGRPRATTLATEWAIVHKPKIERSPGYVIEFKKMPHKTRVNFNGLVFDEKHRLTIEVHNDLWPAYIKEEVPVETPVMISWVNVDEPHSSCPTFPTNQILLPSGASKLDLKDVKEVPRGDYWVMCVDTEFDLDSTVDDDLQWLQTKPFCRPENFDEIVEIRNSYAPRLEPYNVFVYTERIVYEMEPVEYLICYSNEVTAIGVVKNLDNLEGLGDRPLTMQFGTLNEQVGREIYIGCTLVVKCYTKMVNVKDRSVLSFAGKHSGYFDMFLNGRLYSNTLATEWAIVHKPATKKTLGFVIDFQTTNHSKYDRQDYFGLVCDQENQLEVEVYNDQWPLYIRKPVAVESAVILTWIKIDGAHATYTNKSGTKTLLPSGASKFNINALKEVAESDYCLSWVDTCFKASRF